jgi:hypothetical protein
MMKKHIPKFKSLEDERRFWDTHDAAEFWDELTPVKVKFVSRRTPTVRPRLHTSASRRG